MPAFWHWFVAVGTILFIVWCIWLIGWTSKQGPSGKSDEELTGHKWDGDLEEWNNPAPKWWLYLYFITVFWAIGYLVAFPGLGNFEGMLGWSQEKQYEAEQQAAAARGQMIASYGDYVKDRIISNWNRPPSARRDMEAVLQVRLVPTGQVMGVAVVRSSGDPAFDQSAVNAVQQVGRFDRLQELSRKDPLAFEQNFRTLNLTFRPDDLRL